MDILTQIKEYKSHTVSRCGHKVTVDDTLYPIEPLKYHDIIWFNNTYVPISMKNTDLGRAYFNDGEFIIINQYETYSRFDPKSEINGVVVDDIFYPMSENINKMTKNELLVNYFNLMRASNAKQSAIEKKLGTTNAGGKRCSHISTTQTKAINDLEPQTKKTIKALTKLLGNMTTTINDEISKLEEINTNRTQVAVEMYDMIPMVNSRIIYDDRLIGKKVSKIKSRKFDDNQRIGKIKELVKTKTPQGDIVDAVILDNSQIAVPIATLRIEY